MIKRQYETLFPNAMYIDRPELVMWEEGGRWVSWHGPAKFKGDRSVNTIDIVKRVKEYHLAQITNTK